jgi:hypothetical protein
VRAFAVDPHLANCSEIWGTQPSLRGKAPHWNHGDAPTTFILNEDVVSFGWTIAGNLAAMKSRKPRIRDRLINFLKNLSMVGGLMLIASTNPAQASDGNRKALAVPEPSEQCCTRALCGFTENVEFRPDPRRVLHL